MVTEEALRLARVIWDYLNMGQQPVPADVMIAAGTNDLRVAEFAADLYRRGYAPLLVCSGGVAHLGDLLATGWDKTEAEMFADVAERGGVPRNRILLETRAVNTAENIRFTRELLDGLDIRPRNVLFALKPFMQRRVFATMALLWPEMPSTLASPAMTLDDYFTDELPPDRVLNIMMGDLQRLWIYGKRGWSAPQVIPAEVVAAFHGLSALGFTRHLIAGDPASLLS